MYRYDTEIIVSGCGGDVSCPFFSPDDQLFVTLTNSGNVMRVRDDRLYRSYSSGGVLSGAAFDTARDLLYAADMARGAILGLHDDTQDVIVSEYEDKPLKGPHSIACARDGTVYFTDSGPMGTTGLHSPTGSVFAITSDSLGQHLLRPLAYECLAHPAGIALSPNEKIVYVAEMLQNRVSLFSSPLINHNV